MQIDLDRVAKLAKLHLTDEEKNKLGGQLSSILDYVAQLTEVPLDSTDALAYMTDEKNVVRTDEIKAYSGERDAVVGAFPKAAADALEVPGVFNH